METEKSQNEENDNNRVTILYSPIGLLYMCGDCNRTFSTMEKAVHHQNEDKGCKDPSSDVTKNKRTSEKGDSVREDFVVAQMTLEEPNQKNVTVVHGSTGLMYMCNACNLFYRTRGNLGRHQTYECQGNAEKPTFVCCACKKGYKRRDHLVRHMKSFCTSKDIPVFQCKLCPKKCKGEYFFHSHMRKMHGVRRSKAKRGETILGLD